MGLSGSANASWRAMPPDLLPTAFDSTVWAGAFCQAAQGRALSPAWVVAWFAGALMRGYDEGVRLERAGRG